MKVRIVSIMVVILFGIFIFTCVYVKNSFKNTRDIGREYLEIITLDFDQIIELPDIDNENLGFTCTGLTYDKNHNTFWIGNYGKLTNKETESHPSIIQVSSDFKSIVSQIFIEDYKADIQGVSYDDTTDTLWYSDGYNVNNCDLEGNILKRISLGKYESFKPNGVLYDNISNSVWVLCFYKYLLNYSCEGELLNCYKSNYIGQDHLAMDSEGNIYFSAGVDYSGDNNYVVCYEKNKNKLRKAYRVLGSYSVEGICFLNNYLYIANDGYYHDAFDNRNIIVTYLIPTN